jgi:hypothetical protein
LYDTLFNGRLYLILNMAFTPEAEPGVEINKKMFYSFFAAHLVQAGGFSYLDNKKSATDPTGRIGRSWQEYDGG